MSACSRLSGPDGPVETPRTAPVDIARREARDARRSHVRDHEHVKSAATRHGLQMLCRPQQPYTEIQQSCPLTADRRLQTVAAWTTAAIKKVIIIRDCQWSLAMSAQ